MQYSYFTLALLCLTEQASLTAAKFHERSLSDGILSGHSAFIHAQIRKRADVVANHADYARRDALPLPAPVAEAEASSSPKIDFLNLKASASLTPSTTDTQAICSTILSKLDGKPSNPSGMSVCYNVAAFDNSTGSFQAHVLLYTIGAATGKWINLQPGSEGVALQYPGATIQQGNTKRESLPAPASSQLMSRAAAPKLMKDLTFVGKVNIQLQAQFTNLTAMRDALVPTVTLAAKTSAGEALNLTLSNTEASFVNGFFTEAQVKAASIPPPFVLPGTTLGIFPIGLIVTGSWALIFLLAVGFGTIGRIRFRSAYRRKTIGGQYGDSSMARSASGKKAAY